MNNKVILLNKVIKFVHEGNKGSCICDLMDRMYKKKIITFSELMYLQKRIDVSVFLNEEKETETIINTFVNYLRRLIRGFNIRMRYNKKKNPAL